VNIIYKFLKILTFLIFLKIMALENEPSTENEMNRDINTTRITTAEPVHTQWGYPVKCPRCKGGGWVDNPRGFFNSEKIKKCPACKETGIVMSSIKPPEEPRDCWQKCGYKQRPYIRCPLGCLCCFCPCNEEDSCPAGCCVIDFCNPDKKGCCFSLSVMDTKKEEQCDGCFC
jgi:hypothetical protein